MCNGYDGSQEEMLHVSGLAALARGFNVVAFEGPGQPTVIRDQGLAFIDDWDKVVSPVVDWCETQPGMDASRIGLLGYSFGGWLVARAATRERRIAAVACIDGILDAGQAFTDVLPPPLRQRCACKPISDGRSSTVAGSSAAGRLSTSCSACRP
ncbi:MAG: alpha/beta fold hydrolase [Rhizomicrobium sp.]